MDDLLLAWRNVWRNPRRSILTMLAVGFAAMILVFMLSFQFGAYSDMINASVRISTGHMQIQAPGYNEKQEIWKTVDNAGDITALLATVPEVTGFSPRSQAFAVASGRNRTRGAMVIGIDPAKEPHISTLHNQMREGDYLTVSDTGRAIVGNLLAKRLKVGVEDEITLLGQGRDGSIAATVVRIAGIYSSGIDTFDRATLQIPLSDFNDIFAMNGAVHTVVVTVERLSQVKQVKNFLAQHQILEHLIILDWAELMPGLEQSIKIDLVSGIIMYVVLIVVVAFSILNTFLMAIFERTREFGVLMAIGTRPGRLMKLMLIESMSMTTVGILTGMTAGAAITLFFSRYGISLGDAGDLMAQYGITGRIFPRLSFVSLVSGPLVILVVTFFTALYPALRIRKLNPVEAMKAV